MINWKRFILTWPITVLLGSVFSATYLILHENFSVQGLLNELLGSAALLAGVSATLSVPAWLILIFWAFRIRKKQNHQEVQYQLLLAHILLGVLTFVVIFILESSLSEIFIPLALSYIITGQGLLYFWGLKPKTLP